jgi:hypothetical protein
MICQPRALYPYTNFPYNTHLSNYTILYKIIVLSYFFINRTIWPYMWIIYVDYIYTTQGHGDFHGRGFCEGGSNLR